MKSFQSLIDETLEAEDLEELESAADLFQFGVEKGYYNKRQADKFNVTYWKKKNKFLAYDISPEFKMSKIDLITIVSNAPMEIKDNREELMNYVRGRLKALKGKIHGIK
ncbi:hypothetical protein [Inconstantimicrobium mannanitabidum]|uniref:Uncharacterized protein n=1 Tax=Inconstantimicrobium mannanitabidum TaxID=1604901 RepID=A0ACB5R6A7_9CLOT|nr:hypothetical protein [Clostridium sp. TW13]GKX64784.1 hypothetical protein rsdtw13_00420 [Clostridium sp. TW13]